ncbi:MULTISPECIES: type 1 glutamine amidotransferase [unclassified Saccharopolyspora]|uniref:type 1 glutamine amidotransferase n=1 Tax=unclassified Saccharopolyspora TaxID=2646250 RepID=UPI001CD66922|nr:MULTISPECIES: type 1 glutamine amidotransferase [unclassified Saccharopolyspora]MCA1195918.1 type 1 glutamine amidotransferase [Saccharopolyspora sp. 6V]MCA1282769.1 type 1 glutamine amidotransferase [Saccharopolyspora sp. 7B]
MEHVRMLVVEPSAIAPVGRLGEWLSEAGAELDVVRAPEISGREALDEYDALVVMGGGMGALDDSEHPWLADVRALLSSAVSKQLPVLGVCLGAQLLAASTGGRVAPIKKGPEVGTSLVAKRDAAVDDPLLGPLPLTPDVLQFHNDEVTRLPPGAQLLAASPACENQAFRVGVCAYGVQFHVETTPEIVLDWARSMPETAASARPGQLEPAHLERFHAELAETWEPVAGRFVRLAATPPEQRRGSRALPMA